jgi:phosphoenolpyruvate synthase/pyruvate phosphate dikinase
MMMYKLKAELEKLIFSEMEISNAVILSGLDRIKKIDEIQNLFYTSAIPDQLVTLITNKVSDFQKLAEKTYPKSVVKKIKVRSSANAEDIPHFDGAGLHSSYSAKLNEMGDPKQDCKLIRTTSGVETKEEMQPETVMCAIKGVYASLWNKRAIEERNFARIDQRSAVMGIAVNANYDFRKKTEAITEIANAVIVTRVINAKGIYGYRLSVNTVDNLVTNPTPKTQSEIIIATFIEAGEIPQLSFVQFAKTDATLPLRNQPLLSSADYQRMVEIARDLEYNYCKNVPGYYKNDCTYVAADTSKESSLDMELKIYSNGEILVKQVREFSGQ